MNRNRARAAAWSVQPTVLPSLGSHRGLALQASRLRMANTPKPRMTMPAALFTYHNVCGVNFDRNRLTPPLKISHHAAEPLNTPSTRRAADP